MAERLLSRNDYARGARALRGSSRPGAFSDKELAEYKRAWKNSGGFCGMINWYRALGRYRPEFQMDASLPMPVRILWGKKDAFLSHEMAHASAGFCEQAEVTLFEDATHWVQHEQPEAVNAALLGFFNAQLR